jgi:hypothetical protein
MGLFEDLCLSPPTQARHECRAGGAGVVGEHELHGRLWRQVSGEGSESGHPFEEARQPLRLPAPGERREPHRHDANRSDRPPNAHRRSPPATPSGDPCGAELLRRARSAGCARRQRGIFRRGRPLRVGARSNNLPTSTSSKDHGHRFIAAIHSPPGAAGRRFRLDAGHRCRPGPDSACSGRIIATCDGLRGLFANVPPARNAS